jgi:hypothetical protein
MADIDCGSLADLFKAKEAEGLLDVKFYLIDTEKASYEQVCAEVQGLYGGQRTKLVFADSQ